VDELWFIDPPLSYNGFPMDGVLVARCWVTESRGQTMEGFRVSGFHSCLSDCKEKTIQQYFEGGVASVVLVLKICPKLHAKQLYKKNPHS